METAHVEITTSLSGEPVAPGGRFALVLDITPRAGIHVYAPGDHDYRIVRLELEPNEFVLTYPMRYPPSVEYLFEPLNERVQVYKELFRLRQELSIGNTAGARRLVQQPGATLTVKGVLEYQACTDTICYPPEEVPLAWSVALRP